MFIYAEFEIINIFFKERRSKYKPAYALITQHFPIFSAGRRFRQAGVPNGGNNNVSTEISPAPSCCHKRSSESRVANILNALGANAASGGRGSSLYSVV